MRDALDTAGPALIAIDQSITGTGVAVRRGGEYKIFLIETSPHEGRRECLVCGRELKNPRSKSHIGSQHHQEALSKLSEEEAAKIERRLNELDTPFINRARRIQRIEGKVAEICEKYDVEYAIIEGLAYGSRGSATFDLGGLFHGLIGVFIERGIKFAILPPSTAKRFWTGKGNASKEDMIEKTRKLNIEIPFDFDDNCNDAFVFLVFLVKMLTGELDEEFHALVEKSWVGRG
jgi:Holliday junction resolvasome RuvABC endonuclease subunit